MKKLWVFFMSAIISFLIASHNDLFVIERELGGDSDDVLKYRSDIVDYLEDKYAGKDNLTIAQSGTDIVIDSENFSQSSLNSFYESETGVHIDGTCSIVAITGLLEFYDRVRSEINTTTPEDIFRETMTTALAKDLTTKTDGTVGTDVDNIVTEMFDFYDSDFEGNHDFFNIYDNLVEETSNNRATVFSIIGHSMVGAGKTRYKVTYTETTGMLWWKKTETITEYNYFIVVNDGWSNYRQYSYFPEELIATDPINRWDFDLVKVIE